jgi:hypothetical protein
MVKIIDKVYMSDIPIPLSREKNGSITNTLKMVHNNQISSKPSDCQ